MSITLAIETSCDETAVAVIKDKREILSNCVASQIKHHAKYGGVVPEIASRLHTESIHMLLEKALSEANITFKDLTQVAVTTGPGLEGCLLVGIAVAKSLAYGLSIPLIPVNHIHGHIFAYTQAKASLDYPALALIVSGGHTDLILMKSPTSFERCGKTRDDAAGEAFDKVARYLSLGYPGGPVIEKRASQGNPKAFKLPIAMKHSPFEFSFSGLKTATIDVINSLKDPENHIDDLCASFQHTVIDTLILKTLNACQHYAIKDLIVGGGVAANQTFMKAMSHACETHKISLIPIAKQLCTDNAAMIGLAATHLGSLYDDDDIIRAKPQLSYAT